MHRSRKGLQQHEQRYEVNLTRPVSATLEAQHPLLRQTALVGGAETACSIEYIHWVASHSPAPWPKPLLLYNSVLTTFTDTTPISDLTGPLLVPPFAHLCRRPMFMKLCCLPTFRGRLCWFPSSELNYPRSEGNAIYI